MNSSYDRESVRAAINQLVVAHMPAEFDATLLTPQATLTDVGVASLDAVELIFDIEEKFNITFPDARADSLGSDTLQDLVDLVMQGLQAQGHAVVSA